LTCSTFTLFGGTFTLASGGTLGIGSTAGITASDASGNIQTTTRNFDTGANYTYNGTAAQVTAGGLTTAAGLAINNSVGVTLSGSTTVNGTLTLTSGALSSAGILTLGNRALIARASGSLSGTPTFGTLVNISYSANATTGTEIPASSAVLNNLSISGGTIALGKAVTVNGSVTMTGGTLDTSAVNSYALTVVGNLDVGDAGTLLARGSTVRVGGHFSGTYVFTPGTSTFIFDGTGAQSIASAASFGGFYNLTIDKGSGVATCAGTLVVGGALTVTSGELSAGLNNITVTGTTTVSGTMRITTTTGTKTFTGNVTINNGGSLIEEVAEILDFGGNVTISSGGTWTESGAATVTCAGNFQNDGSYTASTGTHAFSGATKTISGTVSIPNLTVNGTYQNNGTLTVGTALAGTGTLTQGVGATLNIGGTSGITGLAASANPNTVNYNAAGAQTVKATAYNNLIFSGSGAKSMASGISASGNLSIAPTGTATASVGAGLTLNVSSLTLGGVLQTLHGTYGGTGSGATNINPTYFAATTGKLNILNVSPVAVADTVTRGPGTSLKIPIASLLANDTDGNLDTISLTSVDATSTGGAAVSANSTYVFYVANSAGNGDTFKYYISDGNDGTANGTVTVNVVSQGGIAQTPVVADGKAYISFAGIPGSAYDVQRAFAAEGPYTTLRTMNAPADGLFLYVDDPAPSPSAYYRLLAQ